MNILTKTYKFPKGTQVNMQLAFFPTEEEPVPHVTLNIGEAEFIFYVDEEGGFVRTDEGTMTI